MNSNCPPIFFPSKAYAFSCTTPMKTIPSRTPLCPAHLVGHIVLPFFVVELVDRDRLSFRFGSYCFPESFRHLP